MGGTEIPGEPPLTCSSCGGEATWDGEYQVCPNTSGCPAQTAGRLKRWVKEHDLLGWGEGLIERLVEDGLASSVPDLYRLTKEQLSGVERMGDKSAQKVLTTLWSKTEFTVEEMLGALSIPLCGKDTVQMVTQGGYGSIAEMRGLTTAALMGIPGLGPVKARALHTWLASESAVIEELEELGVRIKTRRTGSLTGMTLCFTGASKLPRGRLIEIAEAAGGTVKSSVVKNLSFLVMADANSDSTKARAARKNGTKCLSEEDFLSLAGHDPMSEEMLGGPPVEMPPMGDSSIVDEV